MRCDELHRRFLDSLAAGGYPPSASSPFVVLASGNGDSPKVEHVRIQRILAPNPGPFTGPGTNTYLVVSGRETLIIDPGPLDPDHRDTILSALSKLQPLGVLATHTHEDHAPLCNPLAAELGVPVYGFAPGPGFKPDVLLADRECVTYGTEQLEAVHTPGHSPDHLCYLAGRDLFTGDHIMGGSSVVVEDMAAYLASLRRLQTMSLDHLYPGHGLVMDDPAGILEGYIDHRLEREQQVLAAIETGANTVMEIVRTVYSDVDPALHSLAAMSVRAHTAKLVDDGLVVLRSDDTLEPS
jgi:glyoxylase-like metal-dependent hydrolase (beta-lactamase superfamily II)